jgi:hypothetical protein
VERQFSQSKQFKPKSRHALASLRLQEMVIIRNNWDIAEALVRKDATRNEAQRSTLANRRRAATPIRARPNRSAVMTQEISDGVLPSADEDLLFAQEIPDDSDE